MPADPVRVAVTGAAGQIGYSLLFRIASGAMLGPDQPVILQLLEITPALGALDGVAMELDDCAFPLLAGMVQTDDADEAFERRQRRPARRRPAPHEGHGAGRPARGQRRHLHRAGQGAVGQRRPTTCKVLVVGNPANTNCAHRHEQRAEHRARAVHRHDPARPQPGHGAAGRQGRHDRQRHHQDDDLGQPLGHPVPRPLPRRGQRQERRRGGRRPGLARGRRSSRPCSSAARRSSRPAACRQRGVGRQRRDRPRAHVGDRHRRGRLGVDGRAVRRQLRRARGPHVLVPVHLPRTASGRSSRASTSTTSPGPASTPAVGELAEERDAVSELGLI